MLTSGSISNMLRWIVMCAAIIICTGGADVKTGEFTVNVLHSVHIIKTDTIQFGCSTPGSLLTFMEDSFSCSSTELELIFLRLCEGRKVEDCKKRLSAFKALPVNDAKCVENTYQFNYQCIEEESTIAVCTTGFVSASQVYLNHHSVTNGSNITTPQPWLAEGQCMCSFNSSAGVVLYLHALGVTEQRTNSSLQINEEFVYANTFQKRLLVGNYTGIVELRLYDDEPDMFMVSVSAVSGGLVNVTCELQLESPTTENLMTAQYDAVCSGESPCLNGGLCSVESRNQSMSYVCVCAEGYMMDRCQLSVAMIVGLAVAGGVVLLVFILVLCCCCKHKRKLVTCWHDHWRTRTMARRRRQEADKSLHYATTDIVLLKFPSVGSTGSVASDGSDSSHIYATPTLPHDNSKLRLQEGTYVGNNNF